MRSPGGSARWIVSDHACAQYIARFEPELTPDEARRRLAAISGEAYEVDRAADGKRLFRTPLAPVVCCVSLDVAPDGRPTLVSVWPATFEDRRRGGRPPEGYRRAARRRHRP